MDQPEYKELVWKQEISKEIFKKKYMINGETSQDEVFRGVSEEISKAEKNNKLKSKWFNRFYEAISNGRLIPAGRVLANARPETKMPYFNNCYTISVEDSIDEIYNSVKEDALISRTGGGVGLNFSNLRPKDASLATGGQSSGVISFMKVFNESAKVIQTGGSRRSAHIGILNVDHPEIEDFITCKQGDENKALTQFNISVGITDKFIKAVDNDDDWDLVFKGKVYKTVKAKELYELMTKNAYIHNEPGILNIDTVNKYNNGYYKFDIQETNPCVAEGTLVNTPYGYKKIENIKEGDLISTLHKDGYEPVKTIEIHKNTKVNEVIFSDGTIQKVTDAHIYHVKKTGTNKVVRKRFDELKVGDKIQHNPIEILGEIDENSIEYKEAVLVGILLGDGCYTEKVLETNIIKITTSKEDVIYNENIKKLLLELGIETRKDDLSNDSLSMSIVLKNGKEIIDRLKLTPLYSYEKEIPDNYINDKNKLVGVINGLLASDGNILVRSGNTPLVRLKTSSEKLYQSYRKGLLNLGVKCGFHYGDKNKTQDGGIINGRKIERKHSTFDAYTSGKMAQTLIKILPDNINPKKQEKMNEVLYNFVPQGNFNYLEIIDIKKIEELKTVYDLFCEESDTWITEGLVQQGCGEIVMPPYSLCCLSSLDFSKYVNKPFTKEAKLDLDSLKQDIETGIRFLDNVLDMTKYPLKKIKDNSLQWRRIGLGFTGFADMLAKMGFIYGSNDSKIFTDNLAAFFRNESYLASAMLAKEKKAFPSCDKKMLSKSNFIKNLPNETQLLIRKYGLRNIGINTVAPTGTTSLSVGQNCSSGIEPIFSLQYDRNIRTGKGDETKRETVYDAAWLEYLELKGSNHEEMVDIPREFITTFDIDVYDAIDIQSIWQKYIDHSISKTLNLPMGTTYEEYNKLFHYAYKKELKGFTTFNPEGSMKGILETPVSKKEDENRITIKRPKELICDIHEVKYNKEVYILLVGMCDGLPYEIFVTKNINKEFDFNKNKTGKIVKNGKGKYSLVIENGKDKVYIKDIVSSFDDVYGTLGRFISMSLRHKVPLQFLVEQLSKDKNFIGFERTVSRVLKKYIAEGEKVKTSTVCPGCGESDLIYMEGCLTCPSCGWSKCS